MPHQKFSISATNPSIPLEQLVFVNTGTAWLAGELVIPETAEGIVLFAHNSASKRLDRRNRYIAQSLAQAGFATLLIDLLTPAEEAIDTRAHYFCFDVERLAARLIGITDWIMHQPKTAQLKIGYLGDDAGSAAAIVAATERPNAIGAIVSRNGRLDLARPVLSHLQVPTLLIVGTSDSQALTINQQALRYMTSEKQLVIVPQVSRSRAGSTIHSMPDSGGSGQHPQDIENVARLTEQWFRMHLTPTFAQQKAARV